MCLEFYRVSIFSLEPTTCVSWVTSSWSYSWFIRCAGQCIGHLFIARISFDCVDSRSYVLYHSYLWLRGGSFYIRVTFMSKNTKQSKFPPIVTRARSRATFTMATPPTADTSVFRWVLLHSAWAWVYGVFPLKSWNFDLFYLLPGNFLNMNTT